MSIPSAVPCRLQVGVPLHLILKDGEVAAFAVEILRGQVWLPALATAGFRSKIGSLHVA